MQDAAEPLLAARQIAKSFGAVAALSGVSLTVRAGAVTCLLGDNGAGKSTLIKILSGVLPPDTGEIHMGGAPVALSSVRDALDLGIATVYQDLAMVPVMPIYRNFFLGREPEKGRFLFRRLDKEMAMQTAASEIAKMGVVIGDVRRPIVTLSGGERQSVAIARAIYFGARVLILDEPTSALGVKETEIVLRIMRHAKERDIGIVFITHNLHHAYAIGDTFEILQRGTSSLIFHKEQISKTDLLGLMSGAAGVGESADTAA
jgi:simple sugar transport system ATP-binding protein